MSCYFPALERDIIKLKEDFRIDEVHGQVLLYGTDSIETLVSLIRKWFHFMGI